MAAEDLVVDALAVARITRLITTDTLTKEFRLAVQRRWPGLGQTLHTADGWTFGENTASRRGVTVDVIVPDMPDPDMAFVSEPTKVGYLVGCPWCVSPYIAVGTLVARRLFPRLWGPLSKVLAASEVAGLIGSAE